MPDERAGRDARPVFLSPIFFPLRGAGPYQESRHLVESRGAVPAPGRGSEEGEDIPGKLYTSGDLKLLEEAAADELAALRERDRAAEILVLAGSNLLRSYLSSRLSSILGGHFNVHFLTFPDLVALIERRTGTGSAGSVDPLASMVLLEEILAGDIPDCLAGAAGTEGFPSALHSTFTDLAEGGCGASEARMLAGCGDTSLAAARVRGVLGLFARYRETIDSRGGDAHSRFAASAGNAGAALAGSAVLAYGFYDLNELQYRLLMESVGEGGAVFVPYSAESPYSFALPLVERLERAGFDRTDLGGGAGGEAGAELFSAPDSIEEAREVVRRIIELREEGGPRFGEITVMPWNSSGWPPLREALDEAGIPWYSQAVSYDRQDPVAAAALRLLPILSGEGGRSELVDFLLSSPLSVSRKAEARDDPFSLWVRMSAEEGMHGEDGWDEENARLLKKAGDRDSDDGEGREPVAPVLEEAVRVISDIERAKREFESAGSWEAFSSIFAPLVESLFGAEESREVAAAARALAALDSVSGSCSARRFRRIARRALPGGRSEGGRFGGEGVNVVTAGAARGIRSEVTFMTGLMEGTVPGRARQDPFIKDPEREAINRITGGAVRLSLRGGRLAESALLFRLACSSASGRLVCSWPRLETGGSREYLPSSYLRFVPGLPSEPGGRGSAAVRVPLRGRPEGTEVPLGENDYDFLMTGRRTGHIVHYPSSVFFARGTELIRSRWGSRRFTPYDGVFESAEALAGVDAALAARGWNLSATALQSWANCPFAFLVEKMVGVESVEEPEKQLTIDHLQRGTLTHLVLERLYRELSGMRVFPLTALTLGAALERAALVTRETLDEFEAAEPTGHPLFWEYERGTITASVRELLEEEAREGSEEVPTLFEAWFGGRGPGEAVTFEAGGRTLSFHGKIDRVDISEGGGFTVIDYKTGSIPAKDQDLGGGSYLQLPVYLLAASKLLGLPVERGQAMLRKVGTGDGKRRAVFSGSLWEKGREEFAAILEVIVGGMTSGLFFASVPGAMCGYCGASRACPTGTAYLFAEKASRDGRAHDYLEMRGLGGE